MKHRPFFYGCLLPFISRDFHEGCHDKIDYIHQNPLKRGDIDDQVDWRYSSARNYAGLDDWLEVCTGRYLSFDLT